VDSSSGTTPYGWLVPRPADSFRHLPVQYQWEFTRRHPYYQMFWDPSEISDGFPQSLVEAVKETAELILTNIGVNSNGPSPAINWSELQLDDSWSAWTSGALSRIKVRSLVAMLATMLSQDALKVVSTLLWEASSLDESDVEGSYSLIKRLAQDEFPQFDDYLPDLLVAISPSASEAKIAEAVKSIVKDYREEYDISPGRLRTDKFDQYLEVWDLREGWTHGGYDGHQEVKLAEIASRLSTKVSTVCDHYEAAFQQITGVSYSRENWLTLIGLFKMMGLLGPAADSTGRRTGRTQSVAGDSASGFTPGRDFFASIATDTDRAATRMLDDRFISALVDGASNDELIKRFELDPSLGSHIDQLRAALAERE
jgi:hypothetical protein